MPRSKPLQPAKPDAHPARTRGQFDYRPVAIPDIPPARLERVPRGLIAEVARQAYLAAPRGSEPMAIATAIALISSAAGRGYVTPYGGGTHLFVLALSPPAADLDAHAGFDRIAAAAVAADPAFDDLLGPRAAYNLHVLLGRAGSLLIRPEAAVIPPRRTTVASRAEMARLFTAERVPRADLSVFAEQPLERPALTVFGAGDPAHHFRPHAARLEDGFAPACLALTHTAGRPRLRPRIVAEPPTEVGRRLAELAAAARAAGDTPIPITWTKRARAALRAFDERLAGHRETEGTPAMIVRHSTTKALRLASLAAIAADPYGPEIDATQMAWAIRLVEDDNARFLGTKPARPGATPGARPVTTMTPAQAAKRTLVVLAKLTDTAFDVLPAPLPLRYTAEAHAAGWIARTSIAVRVGSRRNRFTDVMTAGIQILLRDGHIDEPTMEERADPVNGLTERAEYYRLTDKGRKVVGA